MYLYILENLIDGESFLELNECDEGDDPANRDSEKNNQTSSEMQGVLTAVASCVFVLRIKRCQLIFLSLFIAHSVVFLQNLCKRWFHSSSYSNHFFTPMWTNSGRISPTSSSKPSFVSKLLAFIKINRASV